MGSSKKKKTTMAKLNREQRLRERRDEKEARRAQRRFAPVSTAEAPEEFDDSHLDRPVPELELDVDPKAKS